MSRFQFDGFMYLGCIYLHFIEEFFCLQAVWLNDVFFFNRIEYLKEEIKKKIFVEAGVKKSSPTLTGSLSWGQKIKLLAHQFFFFFLFLPCPSLQSTN